MTDNTPLPEVSGKSPCVHIVVPVYNPPEKLFRDCLSSIGRQLHKNFMCVLVDDGSMSETAAICDEAATQDPRFSVIHKKNEGTAFARRDGVLAALADGAEYISFIDSDDTVEPEYLSMMLGSLLETNSDACFCGVYLIYDGKRGASYWAPSESGTTENLRELLLSVLEIPHKRFGVRHIVYAEIYRTSLFHNVDWDFTNVKIGEDTRLQCQLMLNVHKMAFIPDRLYNYIQNYASAMYAMNVLKRWECIMEIKYTVATFIKRRIPEFDFTADCAGHEAQTYCHLLDLVLASGREGRRLSQNEADEYVRRIRRALKIPGALSRLSRRRRFGIFVLNWAGLPAYRLCHFVWKGYRAL